MLGWQGVATEGRQAAHIQTKGVGRRGMGSGIVVATSVGWQKLGDINVGQGVLTFDGGLQRVLSARAVPAWAGPGPCPRNLWPVEVPQGALGNREVMQLAADQPIQIESDAAEAQGDDPFALIRARALDGVRGICRVPPAPDEMLITLTFAMEQIVFVAGGAMMHCPAAAPDLMDCAASSARYPVLDMEDALRIAQALSDDMDQARSAGLPGIRS
ncbi:Hint domain-containing protein [Roseovarius arcticus]|uniref:Hint domain-containing protein n=1 Tax=Roseovarius arcticus TaxID=2547404 RepID=UPI0011100239|nr:Hint domain-containing protein [Roseovarius arcticus]